MRKKIGLSLLIISIFLTSIIFFQTNSKTDNINENIAETNYTVSIPIIILNDNDFSNYPLDGDGSISTPYLIKDLNITTTGSYGIRISDVNVYFEIRDCYIKADNPIVLNFVFSPYTKIINNTIISDFENGLTVNLTDDVYVEENQFYNCYNGIYTEDSSYLEIRNNLFYENIFAIQGFHFVNSIIEFNTFEKNREMSISNSGDLHIYNNTFLNNKNGIILSYVDFTDITGNVFLDNIDYAIKLLLGTDCDIYENFFIRNALGHFSQAYDDGHPSTNEWSAYSIGNFWNDLDSRPLYPIDGDDDVFDMLPFYNSDGDSLDDYEELRIYFTNRFLDDTDSDLIPDDFEVYNGIDPLIDDAGDDPDFDDLTNLFEYYYNTLPLNPDTDSDSIPDGYEVIHSLNPLIDDSSLDLDGDGFTNYQEYTLGFMPNKIDSDSDGMDDYWEYYNGLNPLLNDAWEDPDDDKLNNFLEYIYACDPQDNDSDGDGHDDGWEILQGTNPNDPADYPLTTYEPTSTETDTFPTEESTFFFVASLLALLTFTGFLLRKKQRETKKLE